MRMNCFDQFLKKLVSSFTALVFTVSSTGVIYAQSSPVALPEPGKMVSLSTAFTPSSLKGIKIDLNSPFHFEFILERGNDARQLSDLKQESAKLIKYFLASLTIPENDMWVNLSPYEKDRIVPDEFGQTEMGRDLLAQDYLLKQITASVIYPEGEVGKKFWGKIYQSAFDKYGTTDIPLDTFNKVWIMPDKAVVFENNDKAFIVKSHLKVMLESDYVALDKAVVKNADVKVDGTAQTQELAKNVLREIVLPELEREVDEGQNFSQLRQVYDSLILATWLKRKIKTSILGQIYVDRKKIVGVNIDDKDEKEKIYQQYLQAFKKGVYNYIKEEVDPMSQEVLPRKYFSGGVTAIGLDHAMSVVQDADAIADFAQKDDYGIVDAQIHASNSMRDSAMAPVKAGDMLINNQTGTTRKVLSVNGNVLVVVTFKN